MVELVEYGLSAAPNLVWLDQQLVERSVVGGKGASLSHLCDLRAPVPTAFALTTGAYAHFADFLKLPLRASHVSDIELPSVRQRIMDAELPGILTAEIAHGWQELRNRSGAATPLAVRSSATAEDSATFSFAGLHDTILDVLDLSELEHAVKKCWSSLWSDRSVSYRRDGGEELDTATMGVVVQHLVRSDVSFVVFTADPITMQEDRTIISASYGLGESIVSGQVTPDQIVIDESGEVESYQIGAKEMMVIPGSQPGEGVREVPVPRFLASQPVMSYEQAQMVGKMARDVADRVGYPADIEGGICNEQVHLFQVRPITTLSGTNRKLVAH